jgi:type III pantothenate kinase
MQKLLVDLGNTRMKWAMQNDKQLLAVSVLTHRDRDLPGELTQAWGNLTRPGRVVVASVTDEVRKQQLAQWLQSHWSLAPEFVVSPAQAFGMQNSYREPARLGCDRWAAMLGAYHVSRSAVCVIDCGSAITLDVVDDTGRHLGGLIVPGVQGMLGALTQQTALSPVNLSVSNTPSLLGTSTREGIVYGITRAISALIQQTLFDLKRDTGIAPVCYLTGGDAESIAPLLPIQCVLDADLVLKGLAIMTDAT